VPSLAEGTEFAGCRIDGVLAHGGMGVVYRATQVSLGRPVALKVLPPDRAGDPEFRARFQREWRMAAAIDHANVIPVYAAGEEDERLYLVMKLVRGTDLQQVLRSRGPLEPRDAAKVVSEVAAALDAAHEHGLVHRDVKPGNVLLEHTGRVYLSDFGLTRLEGGGGDLTETGRWIGTVDYASPEQLEGGRTDARSDVYALGCVLFAALTGRAPFSRPTVPGVMAAHLDEPPPRPSEHGAPEAFDRVIARALAKAPADRYPSAGDLGRAALAAARGQPVTDAERSVARGEAAPHDAPTRVIPQQRGQAPASQTRVAPRPPGPTHRAGVRGWVAALIAFVVFAAAGIGVGLALNAFGDGGESPTGPVSADEVRDVVGRFGRAYEREDSAALGRTLTGDVERVFPGDRQEGRTAVVGAYEAQFASSAIQRYDLSIDDAVAGDVGRATGSYRVERRGEPAFGGAITFSVVREGGRPRIALIAARPSS
jgi:serine/threonine-protein kinase